MHSGFKIPAGILRHHHHHHHCRMSPESTCAALSETQTHTNPTHQLLLDQHHFLPPQIRPDHHQYVGGDRVSPAAFSSVNFNLGLNDINGSEQYAVSDSSIGMIHRWHHQQYSAIKQQSFWESLPSEVSNENNEIMDRHKSDSLTDCLHTKNRLLFEELEATYKPLGEPDINQTGPSESLPANNPNLPEVGFDHGVEASTGQEASSASRKKRRKKKKKEKLSPMARFFESLVKHLMEHQENIHEKFAEAIERLDGERREREDAWRNQERAHMKHEAETRAYDKAMAASREAMIVSILEKITGQRIDLPSFIISPIDNNIVSNHASGTGDL